MKTNTKRILKFALLIALITGAFLLGSDQGYKKGFSKGQNDVIKNQIIKYWHE